MTEQVQAHILKKYDLLAYLGKGAYGIVWKAVDKQTKKIVAIKKSFDAFHNATDAQRTFRQVMFLQGLKNHENIVSLEGLIKAENNKDIYLVFGFMDSDLHQVIRGNLLEEVHRQFIVYQILKGIKYMHTGDIMHRDLKPANILLDQHCFVKVADFGLARSTAQQDEDTVMTDYVATRWYRAPEILFGSEKYTKSVDMWSVGCILAEMFTGKPLFAGTSSLNQIQKVLEVVGRPSWEDIQSMQSNVTQTMLEQIAIPKKKSFSQLFPNASDEAIDLMKKLLIINPTKRMTVFQALRHPYFKDFSDPTQQIQCPKVIEISMDDNTKYSIKQYRQALYQQILKKKRQQDEVRRMSFQKQQQKIKRQYKLQRSHECVSRQRQSKKQERRDILKYQKQNNKYREKSVSRQKVGAKQSTIASKYSQKPLNENNTSTINTRADKSKTYYYVNDKDYYKLGSSYLDKSIGETNNNRKTQTSYSKISTTNHPYRRR